MSASLSEKIESFEAKVAAKPENQLFRFSLGQALSDANRLEESIPHFQFCCESRADWMLPRILLGKAYLAAGNDVAAKELLREAHQLAVAQHHEDPAAEIETLLEGL